MAYKDKQKQREYQKNWQRQKRAQKNQVIARKPFAVVTNTGQVIKQSVLDQYAIKSDAASKQIPADSFTGIYRESGLMEPLYSPDSLTSLLELNVYHYRACKVKARDVAGLGWELKPLKDNPSEAQKKILDDFFSDQVTPIAVTLDRMGFDYEAIGYGAVEVVREDYAVSGPIAQLVHIPAHTLRVHRSKNKYCQIRGNKKRWFKAINYQKDINADTGEEYDLGSLAPEKRATEIIYNYIYTPRSDYYGLTDVIPAIGAIYGDISRRDYNLAFFSNYGVPAYAVFITGNYDPTVEDDDENTFEEVIQEHFKTLASNPHSTLVLGVPSADGEGEVKVEFEKLSTEVKEASFRLYRQDNRDEVLAAHGVPPYRLGIAETGSLGGSTAQESTEIYKRSVIEPRQETLEDLINKHIVWDAFECYDWEWKLAPIDTSDEKHDIEVANKLFDNAALTPNELINYFGGKFGAQPSDHPAMNAHYLNGIPIDYDVPINDDVEEVLKSLQAGLIEVVKKYADTGNKNGDRNREALALLESVKAITRLADKGRKRFNQKVGKTV